MIRKSIVDNIQFVEIKQKYVDVFVFCCCKGEMIVKSFFKEMRIRNISEVMVKFELIKIQFFE